MGSVMFVAALVIELATRRELRYAKMVRWVAFFLGLCVFSLALDGHAQSKSGSNRAAAEALFNQGRKLMSTGKFEEACLKFEASQELDPGLGTMLNLAECYEKTGRTASAWAEYREAIPLARAAGSKTRVDLATERAAALEDRLSTLTIRAMSGDDTSASLEVRRDGVALQQAELGAPIPVDPGEHTVEATAPGKLPWSSKVQVGKDAAKVTVEIPALPAAEAAKVAPVTAAKPAEESAEPVSERSGSTQRTAGLITAGAGVIGLGLGTVFGLQASSSWSTAKEGCVSYPNGCSSDAAAASSDAHSQATLSTVAFIAGGALLGVGAVLYFTAPSKSESVAVRVGPGAAFVEGSFQ